MPMVYIKTPTLSWPLFPNPSRSHAVYDPTTSYRLFAFLFFSFFVVGCGWFVPSIKSVGYVSLLVYRRYKDVCRFPYRAVQAGAAGFATFTAFRQGSPLFPSKAVITATHDSSTSGWARSDVPFRCLAAHFRSDSKTKEEFDCPNWITLQSWIIVSSD